MDMNGFRVECQQLGIARTETVACQGECRRIGHATKLPSLKSHNTDEDPGFEGPIPVTVGTFWGVGGGIPLWGGEYRHATRDHIY